MENKNISEETALKFIDAMKTIKLAPAGDFQQAVYNSFVAGILNNHLEEVMSYLTFTREKPLNRLKFIFMRKKSLKHIAALTANTKIHLKQLKIEILY